MPNLTINGNTVEVEQGKRLVLAIEESGVNIGHRCGGNAMCTTCRVVYSDGEPDTMTRAEHQKLQETALLGKSRLACQIVCDGNMSVDVLMTLENQTAWEDTGPPPEATVTPDTETVPISEFG